jgi:hypothetical protein
MPGRLFRPVVIVFSPEGRLVVKSRRVRSWAVVFALGNQTILEEEHDYDTTTQA